MLAFSIILVLIGIAATIYGVVQRDTGEYLLASAFGSEKAATIDAVFYIGIAVLAIGAILLIVSIVKRSNR